MIVQCSDANLEKAARLLSHGGLVAFPTETYYGLGVDPFNRDALQRLFEVKHRSQDKPVLVLIADQHQLMQLAESIPAAFTSLMSEFWPGPLTLVFPVSAAVPVRLTGGTGTVGIRQTPDPTAGMLLQAFAGPVTATSANISGEQPAVTAAEVMDIFGTEVDLILDGGPAPGGKGSTLVGYNQNIFCIRPGRIDFSILLDSLNSKQDGRTNGQYDP